MTKYVIEMKCVVDYPPQRTFYAGYQNLVRGAGEVYSVATTDILAAPVWSNKEAAEFVVKNILGSKACYWEVAELEES